ncbi:tetratricopeptide repeat protein [Nitrosococcus watsonii]|uniref:TPR repeat-containing protein n=1 Tax=Nitrosococcus watsoni (strain C-113) TaxID=105559 RepID=D8K9W9_NITWC|nr:hypothetical protein [Nitrosococcus watsonii]ADJ29327.1 conserved hypothetical protein [Nitrosococcus watsonii C-113]
MNKNRSSLRTFLPFFLILLLVGIIYFPGLSGGFIFDDISNIVQNSRLQVDTLTLEGVRQAAFSGIASSIGRPLSQLSFWVNYYCNGLDPFYFKLTNLIIHILNGILLFCLTLQILFAYRRSRHNSSLSDQRVYWIAIIAVSVWLLHPLGITSVLFVVQRMNSLASLFVLAGLICYMAGRERLDRADNGFGLMLGGLGFGFLAVLSKENGALLPLFMLVIEATIYRFSLKRREDRIKLNIFFAIIVGLPALAFFVYVAVYPEWLLSGYQTRDFTLYQRLLTEARVLWLYISWIFLPNPIQLSLFHDDIIISHGMFTPYTTVLAVIGLLLIGASAFYLRNRIPLLLFSVAWFLAGHSLESSVIGLELVHEHRNYLPMYGPILAISYLILGPWPQKSIKLRAVTAVSIISLFVAVTALRVDEWRDVDRLRIIMAEHHPESPRATYEAGLVYANVILKSPELEKMYYEKARQYFLLSTSLSNAYINGLFAVILLDQTNGRPVDHNLLKKLELRLASMPLNGTVIEPFRGLVDWTEKRVVSLDEDEIVSLFEAALGNGSASHGTRAALFSTLSRYYLNSLGQLQDAVNFAIAAINENPREPIHHLSLADLAVKFDNYSLAIAELNKVKKLDTKGAFTLQIESMEDQIYKKNNKI